jgi:catechol 2,3-dioxygenase-like lactoylglutathione lyase family enzyme
MSSGFRFIYTGIRVKDMKESLRFYTDVLGMVIVEPIQKTTPTKESVVTLKSRNSEQLSELFKVLD